MVKKIKNILSTIVVLVLTLSLVQYMGYRLDPPWSQCGFEVIKAFHSLENNSLDVIVYGSSIAWKGFDTRVLYDKYNINAYNYGCNWQALNTIQLFLEDSFTTQSPKVVCIEVGKVDHIENDTDLDGQIYYSSGIPTSKEKIKYITTCLGTKIDPKHIERYVSYVFPLVMFHENWDKISYENYLEDDYEWYVDRRGYCENSSVYECHIPDYRALDQLSLNEDSINFLDEIVSTCNKNNVGVIFYTTPSELGYNYGVAMKEYAEEKGCGYIDFYEILNEVGIDGASDFQDDYHLNDSGAKKIADYIGTYIVNNCML